MKSLFSWVITNGWWISVFLMLLAVFGVHKLIKGIGDGYQQGVIKAIKDNPGFMIARIGLWLLFVVSVLSSLSLTVSVLSAANPILWQIIIQIVVIAIDLIFTCFLIASELYG
jgi:hypothetical protein